MYIFLCLTRCENERAYIFTVRIADRKLTAGGGGGTLLAFIRTSDLV